MGAWGWGWVGGMVERVGAWGMWEGEGDVLSGM